MTKKCKCRKDVMVVVIDSSTPYGGTFCDFLKELSPEKRCKYNYVPFYANTSTEAWVDKLKCKLQQLCKKNCKKPNVLSTLFDTNLEMLLARVQACVNCFFLTHSTSEVNSVFANFRILPAGKLKERTNAVYENDGTIDTLLRDESDDNYTNSLNFKMAGGTAITTVSTLDAVKRGVFVASYGGDCDRLGVSLENLAYASTLGDRATRTLAISNRGAVCMTIIEGVNYAYIDQSSGNRLYYKLYGTESFGPGEIASYAGLVPVVGCIQCDPVDSCYQANPTLSAAMEFNKYSVFPL